MPRYACIKNGVIECFMQGESLSLADMQSGMDALVELPEGEWNYGDTVNTTVSDKLTLGNGPPHASLGKNGWTYIDISNGNVFRKVSGSW